MATVSKAIADEVVAGKYPEDGWARIIKYTNMEGGDAYGLEQEYDLGKYHESEYVRNPTVYWEAKNEQ